MPRPGRSVKPIRGLVGCSYNLASNVEADSFSSPFALHKTKYIVCSFSFSQREYLNYGSEALERKTICVRFCVGGCTTGKNGKSVCLPVFPHLLDFM